MIGKHIKYLCNEDISLIENYYKAINDNTQVWHCHHRLETEKKLSFKELIDADLYYNRPAKELIFLTPFEHMSLHHKDKIVSEETRKKMSKNHYDINGKNNPMYGKTAWNKGISLSEETKAKMRKPKSEEHKQKISESLKDRHPSEETRKKMSISSLGNKANKGYKWVHNDKEVKMVKPNELEYYLNKGYKLGRK